MSVGCLLLATAVALVSGTVDGLNFFGDRVADTTPRFSDPPNDDEAGTVQRVNPRSPSQLAARAPGVAPIDPKPAPPAAAPKPSCARPGYAAVLDPDSEPVGTALARSLTASDLQTRIITIGTASGATKDGLGREDVDRILAGDASSVAGRLKEGTLLVAQLKVLVRDTVIADSPMTEVRGTMDLTIVRNVCGTITVQRHPEVFGRSVNETLDDGVRGLGEIFKEKIADLAMKGLPR